MISPQSSPSQSFNLKYPIKHKTPIFCKPNIHLNSQKSIASTLNRKTFSCKFSFAETLISTPSKINDKEIQQISQTFGWIKSLKVINLDFKNFKGMTDKGLFFVSENLKKLSSLNTLIIHFAGCAQITNIGIKRICDAIKKMKFLQKLDLNFQG